MPTEGQTKAFPRGNRTAGIMPSLEQRPRGDGGITARVIWRQDGQRTAEKFAVGRNPLPFLLQHEQGASETHGAIHIYKYADFNDILQVYRANPDLLERVAAPTH